MTRQGPDFHDNPRRETQSEADEQQRVLNEAEKRTLRRGTDMARVAIGKPEVFGIDEKLAFVSDEAQRLERLITNSDIKNPNVRSRIVFMMGAALDRAAISEDEAKGLAHYLENTDGFSDESTRPKDVRESQATTN